MKFEILTIFLLSVNSITKIEFSMQTIVISNSIEVKIVSYGDDIEDKKLTKVQCAFNRQNFCQSETDAHVFELYYQDNEILQALKQDNHSYSIITYPCTQAFNDTKENLQYLFFENPYSLLRTFQPEPIKNCRINDIGIPYQITQSDKDISENQFKFHQVILSTNEQEKLKDQIDIDDIIKALDGDFEDEISSLKKLLISILFFIPFLFQ